MLDLGQLQTFLGLFEGEINLLMGQCIFARVICALLRLNLFFGLMFVSTAV